MLVIAVTKVKVSLCEIIMVYGGVEEQLHLFLTSASGGVIGQRHASAAL